MAHLKTGMRQRSCADRIGSSDVSQLKGVEFIGRKKILSQCRSQNDVSECQLSHADVQQPGTDTISWAAAKISFHLILPTPTPPRAEVADTGKPDQRTALRIARG